MYLTADVSLQIVDKFWKLGSNKGWGGGGGGLTYAVLETRPNWWGNDPASAVSFAVSGYSNASEK